MVVMELLGDIDYDTGQMAQFQVVVTHHQNNVMVDALTKAGMSRSFFLKPNGKLD